MKIQNHIIFNRLNQMESLEMKITQTFWTSWIASLQDFKKNDSNLKHDPKRFDETRIWKWCKNSKFILLNIYTFIFQWKTLSWRCAWYKKKEAYCDIDNLHKQLKPEDC